MADESIVTPERVAAFEWNVGDVQTVDQADLIPITQTLCMTCLWRSWGVAKCRAFPEGIPAVFWGEGGFEASMEHRSAYPGDHGYQYTPSAIPE